jgi:type II secretion system protein H
MNPPASIRSAVRDTSGFTLVEMMVVLTLIAILTAMIIPEMKGTFEDGLLRATGRELVNVIELASSRAISLNQTVQVKLDLVTRRYKMERQSREGAREDFEPIQGVSGSQGTLDKRITIQFIGGSADSEAVSPGVPSNEPAQEDALVFYPDGTANRATLALKDRAGFGLELDVNPITSRVSIREPAHE